MDCSANLEQRQAIGRSSQKRRRRSRQQRGRRARAGSRCKQRYDFRGSDHHHAASRNALRDHWTTLPGLRRKGRCVPAIARGFGSRRADQRPTRKHQPRPILAMRRCPRGRMALVHTLPTIQNDCRDPEATYNRRATPVESSSQIHPCRLAFYSIARR